jgi:20S proteasome subunit beta 4
MRKVYMCNKAGPESCSLNTPIALQAPYNTNLLLAGYDKRAGASLYWFDYLGTMHKMNLCGTGYGSYFALALFDKEWHPALTQDDAFEMMKKGVEEVRRRLVVAPERFRVKVVTQDGIKDLGYI